MTAMITKNTDNAGATASLARESEQTSEKGRVVVDRMVEAMTRIDQGNATIMEQVNASNKEIAGIVKVVEQIAKKTQIINEIVNKTELLSFNASVEAARAGEHGKGFAVVAEEVGNLARLSGAAAEEISTLIDGSRIARECGDALNDIVGNVSQVTTMANDIASASHEQARGIAEINKAMNQLDQMTQQNAATSEECASSAEELSAQASALTSTVARLEVTIHGGQMPTPAGTPVTAPVGAGPAGKVLKFTAKERAARAPVSGVRKVSGGSPNYDSDGFTDI